MSGDEGVGQYRAARGAFSVRIDDDTLNWNERAEQLHRLNPSATLVWDALRTWATADAVSARIHRAAQLDPSDVRRCVEELYEAGVVERRVQPAGYAPSPSSTRN